MIVVAMIGLLASFGYSSYAQIQSQGTDSKRKTDLGQVKSSLELYYSVKNQYPASITWGSPVWLEGAYTYMKPVPQDPKFGLGSQPNYCYTTSGSPPSSYTLYANLENSNDKDIKTTATCLGKNYNYYITSPF
ncbi:MAG: hypothetical protein A3F33_04025 [Candidatus Woykebacteria bacterium RIFCSPHIGHO2_12_FULL_43_10]|uniref:Type II secretion system protein GspG C-terminal domain-containing protein n=2 Tax=Candidatus Woykeibacteriota TaxID=1817899 RepID=A0A1G1WWQ2_9BACT|nr:MAG: hypothetical protein A2802_00790 [Candidatus Woykebacteria bacterium RIFCSPHIGHO2_01_FULL_43_29]OGY28554.1 MAG: hypothetical protein A3J50_03940 [Candidatus Woykebacteria bacterium RIFCSPHIGHO2_02_FULL_43_16b]OGY29059.1 MAG: hypothetical protein A3F33_04025 [Candidatus Woykebacteria bacterium RIFCSPHIGHO2_12_FULL_43_10]OGY32172.1 MAG: hypothetical protein A3A61_01495 [Candidatus Woykebacteria bacterium RIFCSPLOWO2_01_FULL_43_14]